LFRHVREAIDGSTFSAICFSHERAPGFLRPAANVRDRVHGFLMLVERGDYVVVFKSGLDVPSTFKSEYLGRTNRSRVEAAVATVDAVFERIRVQSTSPSKQVLRSKTLEAANLESSMPLASASRYFTQNYSVRRADGHISATPSTGRISKRGERGGYDVAIAWAATVIDQLTAGGETVAPFIRNFARRLDLDSIPAGTNPLLFAVDVPQLTDLLLSETATMRLVRQAGEAAELTQLNQADVETVLAALDESFPVRAGRPDYRIRRGNRSIGTLRIGKTRISLRKFELPQLAGIEIENSEMPVGEDPDRAPLARYLDREKLFTILFTDPALAYVDGELFRDEAMLDGGAGFLRHLVPFQSLATATSEKGDFEADQANFSGNSVFRKIIDDVAIHDDILVCDDLGDEWADFVGINTQSRPPSINFYHGKHGGLSLSASAFHDAVGQAEKNLGRLALPPDAMEAKYNSWLPTYVSGKGVHTTIARVVRGGGIDGIRQRIDEVRQAPDTVRHVYIVTTSLSKAQVEAEFEKLANGGRPLAHFVQLYSLLMNYFSACSEMGAVGFVACRP
jgi:hypothetical protein